MSFGFKPEEYYKRFIELQEKLRKSEEERLKLEMKFNEMVRVTREEEQLHYRKLRSQYKRFLEEDRRRQDRNERILRTLERIDSRVAMLMAKTERFKLLRQQYQTFLDRVYKNSQEKKNKPVEKPQEKERVPINTDDNDIVKSYLQNLSSNKLREMLRKEEESRPKLSVPTLKTSDFPEMYTFSDLETQPNYANSIADDIMSSIFSRNAKTNDNEKYKPREFNNNRKFQDTAPEIEDTETDDFSESEEILYKNPVEFNKERYRDTKLRYENQNSHKVEKPDDIVNKDTVRPFEEKKSSIKDFVNIEKKKGDNTFQDASSSGYFCPEVLNTPIKRFANPDLVETFSKEDLDKKPIVGSKEQRLERLVSEPEQIETIMDTEFSNFGKLDDPVVKLENTAPDKKEVEIVDQQPPNAQNSEKEIIEITDDVSSVAYDTSVSQIEKPVVAEELTEQHEKDQDDQKLTESQPILGETESASAEDSQPFLEESVKEHSSEQVKQPDGSFQPVEHSVENQPVEQYEISDGQHYELQSKDNQEYDGNVQQYDENAQSVSNIEQYDQQQYDQQQYDQQQFDQQQYDQQAYDQQYAENPEIYSQYDEQGQFIQPYNETVQYDENGQPIAQYDENGQLIQQQYDENGQSYDPQYGNQDYNENQQYEGQYADQQYDEHGQLIQQYEEQAQYDENGQLIQQQYDQQYYDQEYQQQGGESEIPGDQQNFGDQQNLEAQHNVEEEQVHGDQSTVSTVEETKSVENNAENAQEVKKTSNVMEMLDTDTESSVKQETKVSNDSDFDFSNSNG